MALSRRERRRLEQLAQQENERQQQAQGGVVGGVNFGNVTSDPLGANAQLGARRQQRNRFRNIAMRGLRGVSEILEPLQLPQDLLFATIAGLKDPSITVTQSLRRQLGEVQGYFDPRVAAERFQDGRSILKLYGASDTVAKWGGAFMDFTVDPLLAGTVVKSVGRVARGLGAVDDATDIIRFGERLERATNPLRPLPDVAERRLGEFAQKRIVEPLLSLQFGGRDSPDLRQILANSVGEFLPKTRQRQFALGAEAGAGLTQGERTATVLGEDVSHILTRNLTQLDELLNPRQKKRLFGKLGQALGMNRQAIENTLHMQPAVRDRVIQEMYDQVQEAGILFNPATKDSLESFAGAKNDALNTVARELSAAREGALATRKAEIGARAFDEELAGIEKGFDVRVAEVREIARKNNMNPDHVEDVFRQGTRLVVESDALAGFHLSMFEPVKEAFLGAATTNAKRHLDRDQLLDLWSNVVGVGMGGTKMQDIRFVRLGNETVNIKDLFGVDTVRDLLDGSDSPLFASLDIDDFLTSLKDGHLRRTFGAFQDVASWRQYQDQFTSGKLMASNFIDEAVLKQDFATAGLSTEADLILDYANQILPSSRRAGTSPQKGTLLRQSRVFDHLVANGVSPGDARRAMGELANHANSDKYKGFLKKLEGVINEYESVLPPARVIGGDDPASAAQRLIQIQNPDFVSARKDIDDEYLQILGELSDPLVSLGETARFTRAVLPRQQFLSNMFKTAKDNELVRPGDGTRPPGWVSTGDNIALGAFHKKFVHPFIARELNRALKIPEARPKILQGIEKAVTKISGGFLASPNVIVANMAGGVATSAQLGINPAVMLAEMFGAARDIIRMKADPTKQFDDLREMRRYFEIDVANMASDALGGLDDQIRQFSVNSIEAQPGKFRTALDKFGRFVNENTIEKVAGVPFTGLRGFAQSESIMRVAAFRAAKKMGMNVEEAAEMARLSTFDYSELPEIFRVAKKYGILLFPGFPYFLAGRTLGAALKNPGTLAAQERMSGIISDLVTNNDEELRLQLWANMPEWLREEQGTPLYWQTRGDGETKQFGIVPFQQIVPTTTFYGAPFIDAAAGLGLLRPFVELFNAARTGTGEAALSERFGNRVFTPDQNTVGRLVQSLGFLFNNLAPGGIKKLARFDVETLSFRDGLVGDLLERRIPLPSGVVEDGFTLAEHRRQRVERTMLDNVISSTLRSVTPVAIGDPKFANVRRHMAFAQRDLDEKNRFLRDRIRELMVAFRSTGDEDLLREVEMLRSRQKRNVELFRQEWIPLLNQGLGR